MSHEAIVRVKKAIQNIRTDTIGRARGLDQVLFTGRGSWSIPQPVTLRDVMDVLDALPQWIEISKVPSQTEVLVCNQDYLGWHCVAIQNAAGEWHEAGSVNRSPVLYQPTHFQYLKSIENIQKEGVGGDGR